jgi:hypothetical protein
MTTQPETKTPLANCENCGNTGFYGDNGPGIQGNHEYHHCGCRHGLALHIIDELGGAEGNGKIICLIEEYGRAVAQAAIAIAEVDKMFAESCRDNLVEALRYLRSHAERNTVIQGRLSAKNGIQMARAALAEHERLSK